MHACCLLDWADRIARGLMACDFASRTSACGWKEVGISTRLYWFEGCR